jgi:hypothetical protein
MVMASDALTTRTARTPRTQGKSLRLAVLFGVLIALSVVLNALVILASA